MDWGKQTINELAHGSVSYTAMKHFKEKRDVHRGDHLHDGYNNVEYWASEGGTTHPDFNRM